MAFVYGPVPSWRLGSSLGIDLVSRDEKTCSFDCIYCQLGETVNHQSERQEFVPIEEVEKELHMLKGVEADCATFSGVGEPTLASNLGEGIILARKILGLPIAVLTNSSLIFREDVQEDLLNADLVVAKLDAADEATFQAVNRPIPGLHLNHILTGLREFRKKYRGKLALQMMFVEVNKNCAADMARIAEMLSPDEVQINTPLRPCSVTPLPPEEIAAIKSEFKNLKRVISVYEAPRKPQTKPLNITATKKRRPE